MSEKQNIVRILAVESSCDDTCCAVSENGEIRSNVIFNQKVHEEYGGVVPELASRAHMQKIVPVVEMALKKAGMTPADIDYVNAHGTSTPLGDELELGAVRRLFGDAIDNVSMSSTKSAIGHLLGGAGAVETIFCILALRDQIVPPTLNLENPSESCAGVDLVPGQAKKRTVRAALNNSFGFGGTNASLIVKRVED